MTGTLQRCKQRGAASLAVVMVLFFIMAMVAAYTNRNLVFEQRTSANSYRAARSLAAADAAVDWTIGMLNGGVIGTACTNDAGATDDFRTRYLTVEPDGKFKPVTWPSAAVFAGTPLAGNPSQAQPSCSGVQGGGWACSCPSLAPPALLNAANSEEPAFAVGFVKDSPPGVIDLRIRACNSIRSGTVTALNVNGFGSCHVNDLQPTIGPEHKNYLQIDAMTMLRVSLGLVSALPVVPSAALTVVGPINQTVGSTLTAINPDPLTGLALHAGGTIGDTTALKVAGPAGSTTDVTAPSDNDLSSIQPTDFFRKALGMPAEQYKDQPAAVTINCTVGCGANASVLPKLSEGPTRVIYIEGNLNLDTTTANAIGSSTTPAMLVVTGNVTVSAPIDLKGVLFVGGNLTWTATGAGGAVYGAVIVGGSYIGNGSATIAYDRQIVQRVHKGYGSFVRVPGTWNMES
jgi:hypothetical protein